MLAICKGMVLKPVIMFIACVINLRKVYPEAPCFRGTCFTGMAAKRFVPQLKQHINGHKSPFVVREGFGYLGAKDAEGADLAGDLGAHYILQGQLGYPRSKVSPEPVLLVLRRPIDDVIPFRQRRPAALESLRGDAANRHPW